MTDFDLAAYQYHLPPELIAQEPLPVRDAARLMILGRHDSRICHGLVSQLAQWLPPKALLVANNSRVVPARVPFRRRGGGQAEMLLLTPVPLLQRGCPGAGPCEAMAEALLRPTAKFRPGDVVEVGGITVELMRKGEFGRCQVCVRWDGSLEEILGRIGQLPLPPYIKRSPGPQELPRYQTTHASSSGSVAAPTAGLHFTPQLREALAARGHGWAELTLHVGYGTFSPVRCADVRQHVMHAEYAVLPQATVEAVAAAQAQGRSVIAVGTTTARVLEAVGAMEGGLRPYEGYVNIFIRPGHNFRVVDGLLTNFHLPGSTLLILVAALAGREKVMGAYEEAVRERYRFFSWGDAMLIT